MASIPVFVSCDPSDRSIALDLQRALVKMLPDVSLRFWDASQYPDTEYRAQVRAFLETAKVFIAVHSPDYEHTPDVRFEADTAVEVHRRRQGHLMMAIVQSRFSAIPPHLQGISIFPNAEEAIEGVSSDRQLQRTAYQITELVRTAQTARPEGKEEGQWLPLTLPDLQERLMETADRHNLSDVLKLLQTIVHNEQLTRETKQLQDDLLSVHIRSHIDLTEYQYAVNAIRQRIEAVINALNDDFLLRKNWRILFLDHYRKTATHQTTAFYFPVEEIKIPETLNLPVAPDGREEYVGFLSYEQKLEFRRLLLLCQDAIAVEKYAAAHNHCEQVRSRIDPQSAQLYEYLLITYVKKETAASIIRRMLDDIPSGFNYVRLFSDRYNQYQTANPPQCPSGTGEHNQVVSVEELAAAMQTIYSEIDCSAITNTGKRACDEASGKKMIGKTLESFTKLYNSLSETKIFLDTLIIELVGGGKYSWLERLVVQDNEISFISNAGFDLKGKVDELLGKLERADTKRVPPKQREMIREDLFWGLLLQCRRLSEQIKEEQRVHFVQTDLRRSVIRIVQAAVAGHYLVTRQGDVLEQEKSLLRLAIELLIPALVKDGGRYQLPENILLDWFGLDNEGGLFAVETGFEYRDFDAPAVLRKIIADHAGEHNWDRVQENIRQEVWNRFVEQNEAIRSKVEKELAYDDFRKIDPLEARHLMVNYLQNGAIAYKAYPGSHWDFATKIIDELTGKGLLQWFVITPETVLDHPDNALFQYDAQAALTTMIPYSFLWTEETVRAALIGYLYRKILIPEYETLQKKQETDRLRAEYLLGAMLTAFKRHSLPLYLDTVYLELTKEAKFKWVGISTSGEWFNLSKTFDAIALLEHLCDLLPERYDIYSVHQSIADNRYQDCLDTYEKEVHPIRHENRLPERIIVVKIIRALKGIFQFHRDRKYLELPMKELMLDEGRIRWYARVVGIVRTFDNHFENHQIPFDYRAERVEVEMWWNGYVS